MTDQLKPSPELVAQQIADAILNACTWGVATRIELRQLSSGVERGLGGLNRYALTQVIADTIATKAAEWGAQQVSGDAVVCKPIEQLKDIAECIRDDDAYWADRILDEVATLESLYTCAQQRGVVVSVEVAESVKTLAKAGSGHWVFTADKAGIVGAHMIEFEAAIAAAKEKPCGCNTDWSDPNRPLITVCAKHMGAKEKGE